MPYRLKHSQAVLSLRGLHGTALYQAQYALVYGGAQPAAIVAELQHVVARLTAAGWDRLSRQEVVGHATIRERPEPEIRKVAKHMGWDNGSTIRLRNSEPSD